MLPKKNQARNPGSNKTPIPVTKQTKHPFNNSKNQLTDTTIQFQKQQLRSFRHLPLLTICQHETNLEYSGESEQRL